ncbi:MAG: DUF4065 domain-containing protein [Candidatus Kaiserbacteria bacterium]|nr:DUF4065 domain-containing protein [Candidatus Kaiserbacteria bacterium]
MNNKNSNNSTIKDVRMQRKFSQREIADKLNISRASYIALEKGVRDPKLTEAKKLADILGVSVNDFLGGEKPNFEKYKQMLFAFLRNNLSRDGRVPKTKLAKLLYLADFAWYYDHLESMSGMQYRKIAYGPVPDTYFRVVDELYEAGKIDIEKTDDGALLISQKKGGERESTAILSREEEKLITDISKKWKNKRTKEIVDFTHQQIPYTFCKENEIIPYELIIQEDPKYVY